MVYLVDDDIDVQEIVQEALLENSYKGPVIILSNGQQLMDRLNGNSHAKPQVILLDLNMPLMNGFEVLQGLKKNPELSDIPIIVLTASSKKEDELKCFELGCNYYYNKPTTMYEYLPLVSMVKKFISDRN